MPEKKVARIDMRRSLEQLEDEYWGEPEYDSYVVTECHRLREVPLRDLTEEQLRLAIGQRIGLLYLLPVAIQRLKVDPLASGDFNPGDLLKKVLSVPSSIWLEHPDIREELRGIVDRLLANGGEQDDDWWDIIEPDIRKAFDQFIAPPFQ
jgi:hypothetical protein